MQRTEGITSVSLAGKEMLLLVSDEGDAEKGKPAAILLVEYVDLEIE